MTINISVHLHLILDTKGVLHNFTLKITRKEYQFLKIMKPDEIYTRGELFDLGIDLNMKMADLLDTSPYLFIDRKYEKTYSLNIIGRHIHRMLTNT